MKSKNKINKVHHHFHWIHLVAAFILGGYFILSKINMIYALTYESLFLSFFQIYTFGTFFGCLFLFIFSHEKFFPFAKDMEKQESKSERKYLKKYIHHGKLLCTFLIGVIAGPVFSSLSARLLINKSKLKYIIIILADIPSTIITVALAKGVIHFL